MDLNRVMLIGRTTTDLEVKKIGETGSSVVNFNVATNRKYKNKEGNLIEESEFHRCVAFGTPADILGKYLEKGRKVYIEGRLRTRKWEDTTGNTRFTTEIVIEDFIFLDSKNYNNTASTSPSASSAELPHEDIISSKPIEELPF